MIACSAASSHGAQLLPAAAGLALLVEQVKSAWCGGEPGTVVCNKTPPVKTLIDAASKLKGILCVKRARPRFLWITLYASFELARRN